MNLNRRTLLAGLAAPALAGSVRAQGKTVVDFLFPSRSVALITKLIRRLRAGFHARQPRRGAAPGLRRQLRRHADKAQTAAHAGQAPVLAVLLSTDAYTLIDDGLIAPIDELGDTKAWLGGFYPAFLRNTQIGGHQWGVPFQRSTIVMYLNQDMFHQAGLDPAQPPATWAAHAEAAAKLAPQGSALGCRDPGDRLHLLAVPGAGGGGRWRAGQRGRHRCELRHAADPQGARLLAQPAEKRCDAARLVEVGDDPAGLPGGPVRHRVDHHRQSVEQSHQCQIPVRRGHAAGGRAARRSPTGNFYLFKTASAAQRAASLRFCNGSPARRERRSGASIPATSRPVRTLGRHQPCKPMSRNSPPPR